MNEIYGLLSSASDPVPLLGVKVEGDILGRGAKVRISQRFRNQEEKAVEAVYKFPLPEGAAVCGFRADIDGKKIQGQVEERDRAFEMYDDALAKGDGAYLLDEERPNIFTLSVGNLNPNAEVIVEIEYVTLLDMEGQQVRFFLPTTISPRYIPEEMEEDNGIPENGRIHPPYAISVPYGLSVSLNIHEGSLLKAIDSPSHPVKVDHLKEDPVKVSFSAQSVRMDRDLILNMEYGESFASRAYHYQSGQEGFLQLDLLLETEQMGRNGFQDQESQDSGKEIIFLLDCSGSMSGDSIREAKKALEICLRGLEPTTAFTIYRFGSNYEYVFEQPEKYTNASLEKGLGYLKNTDADLGGTEILGPLKGIYATRQGKKNTARNIVLLTDGEVGNEEQIFQLVRKNQESTRVFSIGIGAGCNEYFIKGLARAGRGASEFIYPGERIEPKVLRLFSKITQKSLNNPEILWGKVAVEQAPSTPVIFLESPTTVFARCLDKESLSEKITIRGKVNGQDKEWEINITESHDEDAPVPILWARERIRDLEETKGDLKKRGSRQRERKGDQWKATILDLSKRYGSLSQSTSYVAIEERQEKDKTTGELVLRKIPVPVTIGWHGMGSVFGLAQADVLYDLAPAPAMIEESPVISQLSTGRVVDSETVYQAKASMKYAQDHKTDIVLAILSLQRAEGGMNLNEEVSEILGIEYGEIRARSREIKFEMELEKFRSILDIGIDSFLILSTAILLRTLEIHFSSERETWARIVKKSEDWMMHVMHEGRPRIHGTDLMTWAGEFVRNNIRV
jgi:Ca-activated chloride channel family protein